MSVVSMVASLVVNSVVWMDIPSVVAKDAMRVAQMDERSVGKRAASMEVSWVAQTAER